MILLKLLISIIKNVINQIMKKIKYLIFLVFVFCSISVINAQTGTIQSPEAQSFEPIDATDMVSLNTGDFVYVMPLLNVPSPEGGYPITLSYHGGIAMDQEASWVGLGWNINPGAITRSINGYPDDWKTGTYREYFYDEGDTDHYYSLSLGITNIETGFSVGLSTSWSDNRSMSVNGYVGFGLGDVLSGSVSVGASGASVGINAGLKGGLSINASVGTNGYGFGVAFSPTLGVAKEAGDTTYYASVSYSINKTWGGESSSSLGFSIGIAKAKDRSTTNMGKRRSNSRFNFSKTGAGISLGLSNSISQSDYAVSQSGWYVPIIIPTGTDWLITGGFGKQTIEYHLDTEKQNKVSGPLYFNEVRNILGRYRCTDINTLPIHTWYSTLPCSGTGIISQFISYANSFMDVNEIGIVNGNTKLDLSKNNVVLPNYDNYRVASQGMSGTFSPRLYKTCALTGLSKEIKANNNYNLRYTLPEAGTSLSNYTDYTNDFNFFFDNEYSSSLIINPIDFESVTNSFNTIHQYINQAVAPPTAGNRKKDSRFIEYFTGSQLSTTSGYPQGFIKPYAGIDYSNNELFEQNGIAAFKITSSDGKVYHYSLPVYNHEIISRTFGIVHNRPSEEEGFFEKRQLKKFATHWLLTAVTGPDYVDVNNNNLVDEDDYGYWVSFDYGKWSDGYLWYNPYFGDYIEDDIDPLQKSYSFGRKDIYYLDKISTRTHTALFIKNTRLDATSKSFIGLNKFTHRWGMDNNYTDFEFKSQQILKLNEIILLKNKDLDNLPFTLNKTNVSNLSVSPLPNTSATMEWHKKNDGGGIDKIKHLHYSLQNNVYDTNDLNQYKWDILKSKAVKIIDFNYTYELAQNTPYSTLGRLTLKSLDLLGKGGVQSLPSYRFNYINNYSFSWDDKDEWGYHKDQPENWSLNEIVNPTGGKIQIDYESDEFFSAFKNKIVFTPHNSNYLIIHTGGNPDTFTIQSFDDLNLSIGNKVHVYAKFVNYSLCHEYDGLATITEELDLTNPNIFKYKIQVDGQYNTCGDQNPPMVGYTEYFTASLNVDYPFTKGGIRVKEIKTTDNIDTFRTVYDYTNPTTGETSGKVSYIPHIQNSDKEVPYGAEMPAPIVMYGNVKSTSYGADGSTNGYSTYKFKTIADKDEDAIRFGDNFEITENDLGTHYNSITDKEVNIKELVIKDNFSCLGQLLETSNYNNEGQLLYNLKNNYKTADEMYNASTTQGVIQESFQSYKEVDYNDSSIQDKWLINTSTKISYPSIIKSTTVTQGNYTSTTYFDKYDVNTGQLLETRTFASDGTAIKTKVVPAYKKYSQMGSKVDGINNKNMLTQEAANYTYLWDKNDQSWHILNASIDTWNNNWTYKDYDGGTNTPTADNKKIWRKHKKYVWKGEINDDGTYINFDDTNDDNFNWGLGVTQSNPKWKNIATTTLYDHFSMPLETEDINNNFAATKMGDNNTKVFAVSNAKYNNMYYSGAEDLIEGTKWFSGQIRMQTGTSDVSRDNTKAHTGSYSVRANANTAPFVIEHVENGGKYKLSVWVHKNNYTNTVVKRVGSPDVSYNPNETVFAGDWVQLNFTFNLNNGQKVYITNSTGVTYYDDFRLIPIASTMTSYVYNQWDELTYVLGANNMAIKYEYHPNGSLWRVYTEVADNPSVTGGFKLTNEYNLHYKNNNLSNPNPNPQISESVSGSVEVYSNTNGGYIYSWNPKLSLINSISNNYINNGILFIPQNGQYNFNFTGTITSHSFDSNSVVIVKFVKISADFPNWAISNGVPNLNIGSSSTLKTIYISHPASITNLTLSINENLTLSENDKICIYIEEDKMFSGLMLGTLSFDANLNITW